LGKQGADDTLFTAPVTLLILLKFFLSDPRAWPPSFSERRAPGFMGCSHSFFFAALTGNI
jgi:hypothetical protein